ncbi:MAG: dihydroneopterin aldolase [Actinobacteria bacterium]|nr:dihydroneopterin aldolase [Actinomycetota bacterium]
MNRRGGDTIELRGLRAMAICGLLPEEQARPQPLLVDVDVEADLSRPGQTDELVDTIDYSAMAAELVRVLTVERFSLLERLAQRLCDVLLVDQRVERVTVRVRKLRPPVPHVLDTTGVRITRSRT